jgi:hypothetical protein
MSTKCSHFIPLPRGSVKSMQTVSGFVDNLMAMIKLANSIMYSSFDTYKAVVEQQTKGIRSSRIDRNIITS